MNLVLTARQLSGCGHRLHLDASEARRRGMSSSTAPAIEDVGVTLRRAAAAELRARVRERLAATTVVAQSADEAVAVMRSGAHRVSNASLPDVPVVVEVAGQQLTGVRRSHAEFVQWVDDGYVPIIVVNHRVTDPGSGSVVTELDTWAPRVSEDLKPRASRFDLLRLAHITRSLQALGLASSHQLGGIVGPDAERLVIHQLESTLAGYDERFAQRVAIVSELASTAPQRVSECRQCPWWAGCSQELERRRDVSLVANAAATRELRARGVYTVDDLAQYTFAPGSGAEQPDTGQWQQPVGGPSLAELRALARAWTTGERVVRRVPTLTVPRADVEIDVDMECYQEFGAYLWGALRAERGGSADPAYHAFATWTPVPTNDEARSFAHFWQWLMGERERTHAAGKTFAAYCYASVAENKWLLGSARRFAGKPGIPTLGEVTEFITSDEWIDVYLAVDRQLLSLDGKGLKKMAPLAGFSWRDPEAGGEASMAWYRVACGMEPGASRSERAEQRRRILQYNEDDVRATRALREWMTSSAPSRLPAVTAN